MAFQLICTFAQRACKKGHFFKNCFFCWIKNRKLFSVIESFYDPWLNVRLFMIFFLPQYLLSQSGSFTQTPDRIDAIHSS